MTPEHPSDWHPQDWAIVVEALAQWAGPTEKTNDRREERAWELIESISVAQGLPPEQFILQIDNEWDGTD